LCIYDDWETVTGSLRRIGERISRSNPLTRVDNELRQYLPQAERAFLSLYPDLIEQCRTFSSEQ
jgi:acyl carrier protein phosphodiesterase